MQHEIDFQNSSVVSTSLRVELVLFFKTNCDSGWLIVHVGAKLKVSLKRSPDLPMNCEASPGD